MVPTSYLVYLSSTEMTLELSMKISNIAGRGRSMIGYSDDSGSNELWLIPEGKYETKKMIDNLNALPGVRVISAVALSKPIKTTEIIGIRDVFSSIGLNTANVSDDELAMYFNDQVNDRFTHYIDYDHRQKMKGPVEISIKRLEDHPHFSPDWLIKKEDS